MDEIKVDSMDASANWTITRETLTVDPSAAGEHDQHSQQGPQVLVASGGLHSSLRRLSQSGSSLRSGSKNFLFASTPNVHLGSS